MKIEYDDNIDANIDWKKNGFDSTERNSRRIDEKKAAEYKAKEKKSIQPASLTANNLPGNLNKIRKKIKDIYDDEEDDDESENTLVHIQQDFSMASSLSSALSDEEKRQLLSEDGLKQTQSMQKAGKHEAIVRAAQIAKEVGVKKLDSRLISKHLQGATFVSRGRLKKLVKEDIAKELKIKADKISDAELINLLRGVKRIKHLGGKKAVEGMDARDVAEAGKKYKSEKEVGAIILEKSGRRPPKSLAHKSRKAMPKEKKNFQDLDIGKGY